MATRPTTLSLTPDATLQISWSDGSLREYGFQELRDHCPCASCRELHRNPPEPSPLQILSPEETQPLTIKSMDPVGNYAYSIAFSDGHDTGIYQLTLLLEIGRRVP
ncbi:MAG: DUF971 domain-containing protein [Planctomycetota bacterium]|nr:DUF971 domain-containing protein [Planctomycetota bacterium]MEC8338922.1 DUF971 domain-containing protein [Planctomycetota bacterium]